MAATPDTATVQERDWFDKLLDVVTVGGNAYAAHEQAKANNQFQQAVNQSSLTQQTAANTTSNMAKNVLLVVGGTLGMILVFTTVKSIMK